MKNEVEFIPSAVQMKFLKAEEDIVFFGGGAGGGKALKNGSKVLTPQGWVNIESISIGDEVITPLEGNQRVVAVFPQGEVDLFDVRFQDGRVVTCCGDHLWSLWEVGRGNIHNRSTYSTRSIIDKVECGVKFMTPLTTNLDYSFSDKLNLHPYLVGFMLGDGCLRNKASISFSTKDRFIVDKIKSLGYDISEYIQKSNRCPEFGVKGLLKEFKDLGLMWTSSHTKFIPDIYKNSSLKSRQELVQGLMDSDGYVTKDGKLYYYTVSRQLAEDFTYVLRSLGAYCSISEKYTKYKGTRVKSYSVYFNHKDASNLVSLPRKLERVRNKNTANGLRIESITPVNSGLATCISVSGKDKLFITDNFIVTHNTWSALVDALQGIHDPYFFAVFFRSTNTEIDKGLWPEALATYEPFLKDKNGKFIGKSHISNQSKTITFPSGARIAFAYLELDKHADAYYGSEICKIYFEEFQFRSYYQFDVLRSRNRSKAKVKCGIRCTLNPDPNHFVWDFVKLFIDEEFYPIKELSGKRAYFVIINDVLHTSWDRQELLNTFGKNPQSYTYIPATIDDNKHLDESYKDRLDSLSEKKRKQLRWGSWQPIEDSGMYFQRSFFRKASSIPLGCTTVRGYDTAGTAPEDGQTVNRSADWTVGIKMSKSATGDYFIHGMERFQERSGPRDRRIIQVGHRDGVDCHIVMAADVGSAGNFQFEQFAKTVSDAGLICKKDPMPVNKSKIVRAEPFITAIQNGFVYIVESAFSREENENLETFLRELELFDGERSAAARGKWDDIVDACASSFNYLASQKVLPSFKLSSPPTNTRYSQVKNQSNPTFGN